MAQLSGTQNANEALRDVVLPGDRERSLLLIDLRRVEIFHASAAGLPKRHCGRRLDAFRDALRVLSEVFEEDSVPVEEPRHPFGAGDLPDVSAEDEAVEARQHAEDLRAMSLYKGTHGVLLK